MGDFNLDWGDKVKRKKLKGLADKYNLDQLIKGSKCVVVSDGPFA